MKLVKMSLLAATLIASTAFAAEDTNSTYNGPSNLKVSGDAKLFYSTWDGANDESLFNKNDAAGQAGVSVGVTADLTKNVSAGVTVNALSTLGLQNNLVGNVWEGTTVDAAGDLHGLNDQFWFSNAWIAGTVGKTTGKIGRMELDTPLVFSEQWSMYANTFEAAVLINQDLPDTTLVGAYVGGSNGSEGDATGDGNSNASYSHVLAGGQDTTNSPFHSFYEGAYAAGAINNSWEPLTVQAWYFQAQHYLSETWVQADLSMSGITAGLQYAGINETAALSDNSNSVFAGKLGYAMEKKFEISAAFSQTGDKATPTAINVGGNLAASGQSKLYTEAWWNYGYITRNATTAINVTATTPEELTYVGLGLYMTQTTSKDSLTVYDAAGANGAVSDLKMMEVTLEATKSFGPLDASLLYILTNAEDQNAATVAGDSDKQTAKGESYNTVQAYLTYNF